MTSRAPDPNFAAFSDALTDLLAEHNINGMAGLFVSTGDAGFVTDVFALCHRGSKDELSVALQSIAEVLVELVEAGIENARKRMEH